MSTRLRAITITAAALGFGVLASPASAQSFSSASSVAATLGVTASPPVAGGGFRQDAPLLLPAEPEVTGSIGRHEHGHPRGRRR